MLSTQIESRSARWDLNSLHPDWVWEAASITQPAQRGNFSEVFDFSETEVVKFVSEKGALAYLKACAGPLAGMNYFPKVSSISAAPVVDQHTGKIFFVVRMDKLSPLSQDFLGYSDRFAQIEAEVRKNTALSVREVSNQTLMAFAAEVRSINPALGLTLSYLVKMAWNQHWFVDLGLADNWMVNSKGQLVLSDPVHHVDSFKGYRMCMVLH